MSIVIKSASEIEAMRVAGRLASEVLAVTTDLRARVLAELPHLKPARRSLARDLHALRH